MTLPEFFKQVPRAALAFSGGADSAYLLYAARQCGAEVTAYYVRSAFQPAFEQKDAAHLAHTLCTPMRVLPVEVLGNPSITRNSADRCYHCKTAMLRAIRQAAAEDGYTVLLDGTNASDAADDRPGMRALEELSVLSPLRLCGLQKAEIRALSKKAGLFTWNKPAYACLATRILTGEPITAKKLARTEWAEDFLRARGYSDLRVRTANDAARLQLRREDRARLLVPEEQAAVFETLKQQYTSVTIEGEDRI